MKITNFKNKFNSCSTCDKCSTTTKVFGNGNLNAEIMIIGESPGRDEIESQDPLAGPHGEMLNKALGAVGIKKENLYYTNTILCKTNDKNRAPSWEEIQNCSIRLEEEINIVKPNIILLIGSSSLKRFFGKTSTISENHGRWFMDFKPPYSRFFSIFHPSWVLNAVSEGELKEKKKVIWNDIKTFRKEMEIVNFTLRREND